MLIDFDKIKDLHIICLGDIMLDEFVYGSVERISPEAPIPVLKVSKNNQMLGGVGNVVANLMDLGAKVTLFTRVGHDINGDRIAKLLDQYPGLETFLFVDEDYPTVTKTRLLSGKQHIIRVDQEENTPLNPEIEKLVIDNLKEVASAANILLISNYNKGFVTKGIMESMGELQILKVMDSKAELDKENKAKIDVITPNIKELEKYTHKKISSFQDIVDATSAFSMSYKINNVLLTASAAGMHFFVKTGETENPLNSLAKAMDGTPFTSLHPEFKYPAIPQWDIHSEPSYNTNPVDVSGAGDTVLAAIAIGLGLNGFENVQDTIEFASRCAAIAVGKSGTSTVSSNEIKMAYNLVQKDYRNLDHLIKEVERQKEMGRLVGFINGCFDIFHEGHLELLRKAKAKCHFLVVALNSDDSIKRYKGPSRPIISEQHRCDILEHNKYIDAVAIFDEDDPREILKRIKPDFIFKGMDYKDKLLVEQEVLDAINCKLILLETHEITTTKIINKLNDK